MITYLVQNGVSCTAVSATPQAWRWAEWTRASGSRMSAWRLLTRNLGLSAHQACPGG